MSAFEQNTKPNISERYGVAIAEGSTVRDVVLAAGMARNRFGVLLLRLQAEFDSVRGNLAALKDAQRQRELASSNLLRIAKGLDVQADAHAQKARDANEASLADAHWAHFEHCTKRAAKARADAALVLKRTPGEILMERHLILSSMESLRQTALHVSARAVILATKTKFMRPDGDVHKLAGKVLDVWLDPLCHHCDGTGRHGSDYMGEKSTPCRPCKSTGHRRDAIGSNPEEHRFAGDLLADLMRCAAQAAAGMSHVMHHEGAEKHQAAGRQEISSNLSNLRSVEAAAD
jgi:hypothetical protein